MKKNREISFEEKSKIGKCLVNIVNSNHKLDFKDAKLHLEKFSCDTLVQFYDDKRFYFLRLSESYLIAEEVDVLLTTANFLFILNNVVDIFDKATKISNDEILTRLKEKKAMTGLKANSMTGLISEAPWYKTLQ